MRSSIFAGVFAIFASVATAWRQPEGPNPIGNPFISPGLGDIVPAGKPWEIKWTPTTVGPVTLVLLRGPGHNIKSLYAIAESIPNSGSFEWTPSLDLEDDTTHYGIQLIVDADGQYQYTTQFGVSNKKPSYSPSSTVEYSSSTTSSSSSSSSSSYSSSSMTVDCTTSPTIKKPTVTYSTKYATETSCDCSEDTKTNYPLPSGTSSPGHGHPPSNTTNYVVPAPTSTPTGSAVAPIETGSGASRFTIGGSCLAIAAGVVVALF